MATHPINGLVIKYIQNSSNYYQSILKHAIYIAEFPPEVNGTDKPSVDPGVSSDVQNHHYYSSLHPLAIAGVASGGTLVAVILIAISVWAGLKLKARLKVSTEI